MFAFIIALLFVGFFIGVLLVIAYMGWKKSCNHKWAVHHIDNDLYEKWQKLNEDNPYR